MIVGLTAGLFFFRDPFWVRSAGFYIICESEPIFSKWRHLFRNLLHIDNHLNCLCSKAFTAFWGFQLRIRHIDGEVRFTEIWPKFIRCETNTHPHMDGISCKQLASLLLSSSIHLSSSTLPPASNCQSAKVAAMLGLLEGNFAASTLRGMWHHGLLWFPPQPGGLVSLLRLCVPFFWLQICCLWCMCHLGNERWDSTKSRYLDFWGADGREAGQEYSAG